MSRRAFVVVADLPYSQLSDVGKLTYWCTGGTESHVGIFIPCSRDDEVCRHSQPRLSHPSARQEKHVSFDYMMDRRPRFQAYTNDRYYTKQARVWLYPILDVDASAIHAACVEVAEAAPTNRFCYRCNAICWCWPYPCWCSGSERISPSTCVALTLRIIARAMSESPVPYTSDSATFAELNMNSCSPSYPCEPATLTGYTPRGGLEALQKGCVVGRPVEGFQKAIEHCRGGPAASLGSKYPLLTMSRV